MAAGAKDLPTQETKKFALKIEDPKASELALENKQGSSLQHKARHDTENSQKLQRDLFELTNTEHISLPSNINRKQVTMKPELDTGLSNERKAKMKQRIVNKKAQPAVKERYRSTNDEEMGALVPLNQGA